MFVSKRRTRIAVGTLLFSTLILYTYKLVAVENKHLIVPILTRDTKCRQASKALRHSLDRILHSKVRTNPFPHLIVDDIFPKDYFEEIQKNILRSKSSNFFRRRSKLKPRYSWSLDHPAIDELVLNLNVSSVDLKRLLFWNCHREVYGSREVTSAIIKHFWEVLIMRLSVGESFNFTDFSQSMFLTQDHDSYFISPHKDVPEKFVTNLFYISSKKNENVLKDSGTLLLKHVNRSIKKQLSSSLMDFKSSSKYVEFGGKHFKFEQCNFVANRLVSFAPCLSAWHAVPHQNIGDIPRDTIQSFIGYSQKLPLNQCSQE